MPLLSQDATKWRCRRVTSADLRCLRFLPGLHCIRRHAVGDSRVRISRTDGGQSRLQKLFSGAAFPIGLILVVVLGAELFTGNNALLMPPLMAVSAHGAMSPLTGRWSILATSWVLSASYMCLFYVTGLMSPEPYHAAIVKIAEAKVSMPWLTVMVKGIGANWCVCLAIWLAMAAKSSGAKMFGCWLPVMAFVALGYEHSIANMFFIPCGMLEGASVTPWQMVCDNLIPATIGNIIGGALLVGCVHVYLHRVKS